MPRNPAGRTGRSYRFSGDHFVVAARAAVDSDSPRLTMAIPRKLVPSSPVRNLMRRVIRESHRQAARTYAAVFGASGNWSVRVQLVKVPQDPAAPDRDPSGRTQRPFARRPADRQLKQRVRTELDSLLARLAARTPSALNAQQVTERPS